MKQLYLAGLLSVVSLNLTYADTTQGQSVRLNANQQTVEIALPANATTGYQWFVQGYDHDLLILQDYRYVAKSVPQGMTGVGGTAVFTFSVDPRFYDGPQITEINFVYEQPWNLGQNVKSAQVTVLSTSAGSDESWQKYPDNGLGPGAAAQNASLYDDAVQIQAATQNASGGASNNAVAVSNTGAVQVGSAQPVRPAAAAPTSGVGTQPSVQEQPLNPPPSAAAGGLPVSGVNNPSFNLSPSEAAAASNANATASKQIPANTGTYSGSVVVPSPTTSGNSAAQTQWLSLPASSSSTSTSGTPSTNTN